MSHNNNHHLKQDYSAYSLNLPPPSPDASAPPLPSLQQYPPLPDQEYPSHPFPTLPSPLLYASLPVHVYTPPPVYHAQLHQVDGYPRPQAPYVIPPPSVAYAERNGLKDGRREDRRGKPKRGCCCGFWRGCCATLCCCCLMDLCCMSNCCF